MSSVERFAGVLGRVLGRSGGWTRHTSDLVESHPTATLFSHTRRAAIVLLPGDEATPATFRADLEAVFRKASPTTARGGTSVVPWAQVILVLVFADGAPLGMRSLLGNERLVVTPRQTVQGGWVDLERGLAGFRTAKTPFDAEMLELLEEAAAMGLSGVFNTSTDGNANAQQHPRAPVETRPAWPWATALLATAMVAASLYVAFDAFTALRLGALHPSIMQQGQWHRLLCGVFAARNAISLGVTLTVLLTLGGAFERLCGALPLLFVFSASALAAAAAAWRFAVPDLHFGAVEALCGICGALVATSLRRGRSDLLSRPAIVLGGALLSGYCLMALLGTPNPTRDVALQARCCGPAALAALLTGLSLGTVLPPWHLWTGWTGTALTAVTGMVALLPLAALGLAVRDARTPAPRAVTVESSGFAVQTPPLTLPIAGPNNALFLATTATLQLSPMTALRMQTGSTLNTRREDLLRAVDAREATCEVTTINDRDWLMARVVSPSGAGRVYAFTIARGAVYVAKMWGPAVDPAMSAFRALLASFTVPPDPDVPPARTLVPKPSQKP